MGGYKFISFKYSRENEVFHCNPWNSSRLHMQFTISPTYQCLQIVCLHYLNVKSLHFHNRI